MAVCRIPWAGVYGLMPTSFLLSKLYGNQAHSGTGVGHGRYRPEAFLDNIYKNNPHSSLKEYHM